MESARLLIRRMEKGDEAAFVSGIADRALRIAYGFPPDMEDRMSSRIFERFSGLEGGYSLIEKTSGTVIGFLLEVEPEMPENLRTGLPMRIFIPASSTKHTKLTALTSCPISSP